jgi:hypothetical protein
MPATETVQSKSDVMSQSPLGGVVGGGEVLTVGSRCVATPSEYTEELASVVVYCKVCELARQLCLLVVTICKSEIIPVTNPNLVSLNK